MQRNQKGLFWFVVIGASGWFYYSYRQNDLKGMLIPVFLLALEGYITSMRCEAALVSVRDKMGVDDHEVQI